MEKHYITVNQGNSYRQSCRVGSWPHCRWICKFWSESFDNPARTKHAEERESGDYERRDCPIQLEAVSSEEWIPGCFTERRNSDVFSVEFIQEGEVSFTQNGRSYAVGAGEIFLIRPGCDTEFHCTTPKMSKLAMIVSGALLPEMLELLGLAEVDCIRHCDRQKITELMDRAFELGSRYLAENNAELSAIAYQLLLELSGSLKHSALPKPLRLALKLLAQRLDSSLTIDELSRASGVSAPTLHRLFQKHLHNTPIGHYLKLKMNRAAGLLKSGLYSVKEVSAACGYSSPQYFSAEFRKHFGMTPKVYRLKP